MKSQLIPALRFTVVMLGLCCVLYPALVWAVAQLSPGHGEGVQVSHSGRVVGFANVGQKFDKPAYFNSRPSAAAYHADGSSGSNKGPSNPEYLATVKARLDTFLLQNPGVRAADVAERIANGQRFGPRPAPPPQGALVQVPRIAAVRHLARAKVQALVAQYLETSLFGPDHVNVLRLNLALDDLAGKK